MGRKRVTVWAAAALLALTLAGCGASSKEMAAEDTYAEASGGSAYDTGNIYENAVPSEEEGAAAAENTVSEEGELLSDESAGNQEARSQRKLIRHAYLSVETADYPALISTVTKRVEELGGYIESYEAYNENQAGSRSASITARIPSEKLDSFISHVAEASNITSREESVEDVTLQYVDMESHKRMLEQEQERLLALLQQAETLEDIIAIESRLTDVRYQLESMESQLRTIDNQVAYSTVNLSVTEVQHYTPPAQKGTWERISTGFAENVYRVGNGIKEFFIHFVISLPILLVLAAAALVILLIVRLFLRQSEKRNAARRKSAPAGPMYGAGHAAPPVYGAPAPPAPGADRPPFQRMEAGGNTDGGFRPGGSEPSAQKGAGSPFPDRSPSDADVPADRKP